MRVTFQNQTEEKSLLIFQADVNVDCSQGDLDRLLDKCRNSVVRQRKLVEIAGEQTNIVNWEKQLATTQAQINSHSEDFERRKKHHEDQGGRGQFEPQGADLSTVNQLNTAIGNLTANIDASKKRLKELWSVTGGP